MTTVVEPNVLSNTRDHVFKSVENGFFNCKLTVKDGGDLTISVRPDGFVNATQLCKAGKKLFKDWKNSSFNSYCKQKFRNNVLFADERSISMVLTKL